MRIEDFLLSKQRIIDYPYYIINFYYFYIKEKEEIMSFKYLLPVLLVFFLVSCTPKKIDKSGFSIKNNIIYRNDSNTPFTGIVKSKTEGKYSNIMLKMG